MAVASVAALLAVAGYVYAVFNLYAFPRSTPMALNTALTFLALSTGGLCRRDAWPVETMLRNWSLHKTIAAGYAAALMMLCLIGFVSFQSTRGLIAFNQQDNRDLRTVIAIDTLLSALRNAEASQRAAT